MRKRGVLLLVSIMVALSGAVFVGQYVGFVTLDVNALFDFDDDGVLDSSDNCPLTSNPDQANSDSDSFGWVECLNNSPNQSNFGDDDNFEFILPFNFSYFDRVIVAIDVDSNGEIELLESGESCFDCDDYGTHEDSDYIDSIFALNDDLEMVKYGVCDLGDEIIVQWNGYTLDDGDYGLFPLDFEVVINREGNVRWNFLNVNWSSFNNDLYSGLGSVGSNDVDLSYEQSEARTSYSWLSGASEVNQLVDDGIGDVCEEVDDIYKKDVMMITVGSSPYFITLTGSGRLVTGEDFNGRQIWFFDSNTSGLSNTNLGMSVVKTEVVKGTNFNVSQGKEANATVNFNIDFVETGSVYNTTLDVVAQVVSWPPGVLCFKYLGGPVLLGKTLSLDDVSLVGFWSCLENVSLPVIGLDDVGTEFPSSSFESFPIQSGLHIFDSNTFQEYVVTLTGDAVIGLGNSTGEEIQTEIIEMNLVGSHPVLGNVSLIVPLNSSTGQVFGNNFPADSFFDMNFEVGLPGLTVNNLHLNESVKTFASIFNIPWTPICHQFISDSGAELNFVNDVGSNIFVKQFFWCPIELSEPVSCVEQSCLTDIDCRLGNEGVGLCRSSDACVLGCVVDKTPCNSVGLDDACFGGVCENGQCSTCGSSVCEGDSAKIFSSGYGEGGGACRAFDDNKSGCESAFMLSHDGNNYFTSCWYSVGDDTCRGCGPNNEGESCSNECIPSVCEEDSSRTNFVGGPGNGACNNLNTEAACNDAFHRSGDGSISSCFWNDGSCSGCGLNNERKGLCINTCDPEDPILCKDNSSLIFAGGFGQNGGSCPQFADQNSCESHYTVSSQDGFAVSCFWDGENCMGCGPNNENGGSCTNSCLEQNCGVRSSFIGGPGSNACENIVDQQNCEDSFHRSKDGTMSSCYWTGFGCSGCGPNNEQQGDCVNVCRTECSSLSVSSCEDTSYCDINSKSFFCACEPGFEGELPQKSVEVITEQREEGTSVTLNHPEVDIEFIVPSGEVVNVSNVHISTSITSSSSKAVITGLSLPSGVTKSVNLPVPSGVTSLCIVDKAGEVTIETGCSNGVIISCPGSVDGYSCSFNSGTVTVSGLSNTVLGTFIPFSSGGSSGSGPQGASHGIKIGGTKKVWAAVFAGEQGEFVVNNSVFRKISFTAKEDLYGVWFEVDDDADAPIEFDRLKFRTIRVGGRSLGNKLGSLMIDFDVPVVWLNRLSLNRGDIALYRLVDGVWVEQLTSVLSGGVVVHYSASVDGFSYFVIGQRAPTCGDNRRNGLETGVDCGGPCDSCSAGQGCLVDKDCFSFNCVDGLCKSLFSCSDKIKNQGEEDVDCGGPCSVCDIRTPFNPVNYFFSIVGVVAVLGLIFFVFYKSPKTR